MLRVRKSRRRRTDSEISEEFGQTRTKIQNIFQRLKKAKERKEDPEEETCSTDSSEDEDDMEVVNENDMKMVDKECEEMGDKECEEMGAKESEEMVDNPEDSKHYPAGSYVVAVYQDACYIGQVLGKKKRDQCSASGGLHLC